MTFSYGGNYDMTTNWNSRAFTNAIGYLADRGTDEVLIFEKDGIQVHENFTDSEATDVKAIQKSLFALMIGIAVDRRIVEVSDPLHKYLPKGWTGLPETDEKRLTIQHLLTMTTGMNDALEPAGEIGVTWRYNNTAYNYLKRVLTEQTGRPLQELTEEWICNPLGMTQTKWVERDSLLPDGRNVTGLEMSGHDMAQLGLLILNGGSRSSGRLISNSYWQRMLSPGSSTNPAWCFMWWRNDQDHFMTPYVDKTFYRPVIPEAPASLIFSQGLEENRIFVDPTRRPVIVRRGGPAVKPGERHNFDRHLWTLMQQIWSDT